MRISDWSSDVCSSDLDESARLDAGVAAPARLPSGTWRMNPGFDEVLRAGTRTRSGLFITAAQRLGTTPQNVEKDFWVCRSEEHTSELQSLMRISYAVFCLKKKKYIIILVLSLQKSTPPTTQTL